jgi:hypothetical protein
VTRTIRREAAGVPALGMADFAFTAPAGVRLYVDPPLADDHVDRGAVRGLRTDKVTYVFETDGRFDLPALTQPWYDLGARTARSENLPGASVTVAPAPSGPAQGSAGPARRWLALGAAAFAALALAFALLRLLPKMRALGDERRRLYAESEASARDALRQAAASGNAPAAYDALGAWLRRLPAEERRRIRADADFAPLVEALERTLFGSRGSWSDEDGRALARLVRDWRIGVASRATASSSALPPLNPAEP